MLYPFKIQEVEPRAGIPWNIQMVNAPSFWSQSRGGGAVVAVIDTGLDVSHPEIAGRVVAPFDATGGVHGVRDISGHGTHVAGTIAGKTCGMAPEARIMPIKIFPDDPKNNGQIGIYIQDAFKYVLDHNKAANPEDRVVAVNCSWGSQGYDPLMAYFIRRLVSEGVTVVVAAGNQGDGDAETHEVFSYPAYIWEVVTVGALNQDGTGAAYSNSFDGIDLAAPGTGIYSAWPGGGYKIISGTSMAAPHVTGAISLIYDAWRKREGSYSTEDQAVAALMKHICKVNINPLFVGDGVLDLTWNDAYWNRSMKEGFLWIGKDYALIDGKEVRLDVAPYIVPEAGRTMVPLRFLAENFGYNVEWNQSRQQVHFWK
jgi:major intracellular serine protease